MASTSIAATSAGGQQPLFHFVMIKPSHYDDDGYPIQWARSAIPSNTLACLNGLAEDAHRRKVLGPEVQIRLHTYDETNRRVRPDKIIRMISRAGGRALIGLVGVQSNQFPRAVDLARPFLAAGLPVCIGGFHISGCIAMMPQLPQDIRDAQALGISLFAGEAEEGRLDDVLRDAFAGRLAPLYNHMDKLPNLQGEPPPILPRKHIRLTDAEWEDAYRAAWEAFYSTEHIRTVLRRAAASSRGRPGTTLTTLLWFKLVSAYEGVHPLEGGALRRKFRRDRRHGLRREHPFVFYPRYLGETLIKLWRYWTVFRRCRTILAETLAAPDRWTYTDVAIAEPGVDEFEALDLYHATSGGEAALARKRRHDAIRERPRGMIWPAPAGNTAG